MAIKRLFEKLEMRTTCQCVILGKLMFFKFDRFAAQCLRNLQSKQRQKVNTKGVLKNVKCKNF